MGLTARPDGLQVVSETASEAETLRRSTYLVARRTWPLTFLAVFDFPIIDTTCTQRVPSATPLQSLTMMNSEFVMQNAREAARRAALLAGANARPEEVVRRAYGLLLTREPSTQEVGLALDHLDSQQRLYARANASPEEAFDKSLESLAHMLMSSNEFLYVD